MKILIFVAAIYLALAGLSLPANAFNPSFDCENVTDAVQKLVCSDYKLSRTDRLLAEINDNLMKRAEPNTPYFAQKQTQWFATLSKSCAVATMGAAAKACLLEAYQNRMDELRAIAGCSKATAQAGEQVTIRENSFVMVPKGTHILALASNNKVNLNGDFNTINIRHGEAVVAVPAGAEQPFNNMVNTCVPKKR